MLFKTILLLATAIAASANSAPEEPHQDPILAEPACAECQPCPIDGCYCGADHQGSCAWQPPHPPRVPLPKPICPHNEPCNSECICPSALEGIPRPPHHLDVTVCAEGQPCYECDLCRLDVVLSYINPGKLSGKTRICDVGVCNGTCVCREKLLESMKDVLFPKKGKDSEVVDFAAGESSESDKTKDEL